MRLNILGEDPLEKQYAESLEWFLTSKTLMPNRTGIDTYVKTHQYFRYWANIDFPLLRCKKVYPKLALKELLWMLQGRTDLKWLHDHKVTYWDEWELADGTIGKSYGYQYRNFNGVDQLNELVYNMIDNPTDRRLIISLWNPHDMPEMALPPCQFLYQFTCEKSSKGNNVWLVSLHTLQRSGDSFLGVPYNFVFNGFFLTIMCDMCNKLSSKEQMFIPCNVHHTINNYHLYVNHLDAVHQYLHNYHDPENKVNNDEVKCFIEVPKSKATSLDAYLSYLSDNIDNENVVMITKGVQDQYGPIKADIAV